jgi:trehalose 6-phosphate phosphatase
VHGGQIKYTGSEISMPAKIKNALPGIAVLKEKVTKIINDIPCYTIEDKVLSFALHYRRCRDEDLTHLRKINSILLEYVKGMPIELMQMRKVIEVKPKGINKGNAVDNINRKYKKNTPFLNICLGDDVTDEYLFKSNISGINIKVGKSEYLDSEAEYYLKDVKEVYKFLCILYNVLK